MLICAITGSATAAETITVYAAGSLRAAFTELARAFTASTGMPVDAQFGASGLLRQRLEQGEKAEIFASADLGNARALQAAGRAGPVVLFARNRLCAVTRPGLR